MSNESSPGAVPKLPEHEHEVPSFIVELRAGIAQMKANHQRLTEEIARHAAQEERLRERAPRELSEEQKTSAAALAAANEKLADTAARFADAIAEAEKSLEEVERDWRASVH